MEIDIINGISKQRLVIPFGKNRGRMKSWMSAPDAVYLYIIVSKCLSHRFTESPWRESVSTAK